MREKMHHLQAYLAVFRVQWQTEIEWRLNVLTQFAGTLLGIVSMYYLWTEVFSGRAALMGYTQPEIITYFAVAGYLAMGTFFYLPVFADIRDGELSAYLVRPMSYLGYVWSQTMARSVFAFLLGLPIMAGLFILLRDNVFIVSNPLNYAVFFVTAFGALNILFMFNMIIACLEFKYLYSDMVVWMSEMVVFLAAGHMIPLVFLPGPFRVVAELLPFKYVGMFPVNAFMGRLNWAEIATGLTMQLLWVGVFYVLFRLAWRWGIKRYEAFGK
jgi:ABC-2 type transport system permease protein